MRLLDQPQPVSLWITPSRGDETRCLLEWDSAAEQFRFPVVSGVCRNPSDMRRELRRRHPGLHNVTLSVDDRPLARLRELPGIMHAAWLAEPLPAEGLPGFAWVSLRDAQMGFTQGCRVVDSSVRQFLERTGRIPNRHGRDERLLTVGVVGHRQLPDDDVPVLFDRLHQAVGDLQREFPGRSLRMLSSLGPGAEQMMADVALELGIPLVVPLPISLEVYETEFPDPLARAEFYETLDRAAEWYALPLAIEGSHGESHRSASLGCEHRARAGQHIVDLSDVLLAVWDGEPSSQRGAPADLLRYALRPPAQPIRRLLIRHLPVRRHRGRNHSA